MPSGVISTTEEGQDLMASGYSAAVKWCLTCDVAWYGGDVCWHCERSDNTHHWTLVSEGMEWRKVEA